MSSFLAVCNYIFNLHVRRILKLIIGWIARMWKEQGIRNRITNHLSAEFDGDRCDVEYLQETAGVLLIAMPNVQAFTNSCTTHAEDITSCESLLVLQWLISRPAFRRFWIWVLAMKPASLRESLLSLQENKPQSVLESCYWKIVLKSTENLNSQISLYATGVTDSSPGIWNMYLVSSSGSWPWIYSVFKM